MNPNIVNILACPVCRRSLQLGKVRYRLGQITSGSILCEDCSLEFPIVLGRPLLLPPGVPQKWMPAFDEAVGWEGKSRNEKKALAWLADVGVDEAIRHVETSRMRRWQDASHQTRHRTQAVTVTQKELNRARYHISGHWFQTKSTRIPVSDGVHLRSEALEFPKHPIPHDLDERDAMEEIVFQIIRLRPPKASGCRFGRRVLRLANTGEFTRF